MMQEALRIGIIGAMDVEVEMLEQKLGMRTYSQVSGLRVCSGRLYDKELYIVKSGIGKVNAAVATQLLCGNYEVRLVINTGIAGGLQKGLNIGDIVIGKSCIQHDVDVSALGYKKGVIPDMQIEKKDFSTDERLRSLAVECARNRNLNVHLGVILSGDQFVADLNKRRFLVEEFGGICAEMECGAIAQVAELNGVKFLAIRVISDNADGGAVGDYPKFKKMAAEKSSELVLQILERV